MIVSECMPSWLRPVLVEDRERNESGDYQNDAVVNFVIYKKK
jgi:hypothetical protein